MIARMLRAFVAPVDVRVAPRAADRRVREGRRRRDQRRRAGDAGIGVDRELDDRRPRRAHGRRDRDQAATGRDRRRRGGRGEGRGRRQRRHARDDDRGEAGRAAPPGGASAGDISPARSRAAPGHAVGTWTIAGRAVQVLSDDGAEAGARRVRGRRDGRGARHGRHGRRRHRERDRSEVGRRASPVPSNNALEVTGVVEALPATGCRHVAHRGPQRRSSHGHGARQPSTARSRSA